MELLSGSSYGLPFKTYDQLKHYRYSVFCEKLGWSLHGGEKEDGETDQFDRPDTIYVVAKNEANNICGYARLLPTTRPYLLGTVFPSLFNGKLPPSSPDVWELSRFAATDFDAGPVHRSSSYKDSLAADLLNESMKVAMEHGAKRLISVSPVGMERLIQRAGFDAYRAGPPMIVNGEPILACWIELRKVSSSGIHLH